MENHKAIFEAASKGDRDKIEQLLGEAPSLAMARDEKGATPLHYAALHGHREAAKLLINYGADVNAKDKQWKATPAGWAIEYLRSPGGFLSIELEDVKYAIQQQNVPLVKRYLNRFPSLKYYKDEEGNTFGDYAAKIGNEEIQKLFTI